MKRIGFKSLIISLLIVMTITMVVTGFWIKNIMFSDNFNIPKGQKHRVFIEKNETVETFIDNMTHQGIVINPDYIRLTAKVIGINDTNLKPGSYIIENGMNSWELLQRIRRGEQKPVKLVINNMRLPEQFAAKISEQIMPDSAEIMDFVTDKYKMEQLGFRPEELFVLVISNTYEIWWTTSVDNLMKRMKQEHEKFWQQNNRTEKADELGLTRTEVVTLASIVEEETNHTAEKTKIAGLYINRLRCGMLLQSDPTVKYAVGDFSINHVLFSHLATNSPYNTYRYAGLPPGPIRLPSITSIDAVLDAEDHDYLYMCAHESLNGTHRFARTLTEHNRNASKYHAALREWKRTKRLNK